MVRLKSIREYVPRLTIKPIKTEKDHVALSLNDLSIQLDGVEVKGLRSLSIRMDQGDTNIVEMDFTADLDIDVDGLLELDVQIKEAREIESG